MVLPPPTLRRSGQTQPHKQASQEDIPKVLLEKRITWSPLFFFSSALSLTQCSIGPGVDKGCLV